MCCRKKNESCNVVKTVLIVLGVIAAIAGIAYALCQIFKKHFTIEFECEDCDDCETPCFEEPDDEPECCDAEEESAEDQPEA